MEFLTKLILSYKENKDNYLFTNDNYVYIKLIKETYLNLNYEFLLWITEELKRYEENLIKKSLGEKNYKILKYMKINHINVTTSNEEEFRWEGNVIYIKCKSLKTFPIYKTKEKGEFNFELIWDNNNSLIIKDKVYKNGFEVKVTANKKSFSFFHDELVKRINVSFYKNKTFEEIRYKNSFYTIEHKKFYEDNALLMEFVNIKK